MSASDLSSWAESRRRKIEADLRALLLIVASNDADALCTLAVRHPLAVQHINSPVDGQLALCNAVLFDRVDMVFDLYQLGATSTGSDRRGTPMEIALQRLPSIDMDMVRQLVRLNLTRTSRSTHSLVASFILAQQADPVDTLKQLNATGRVSMWSNLTMFGAADPFAELPLMAALQKRHVASVNWILQTFQRQQAPREEESYALCWAIDTNDFKLFCKLLETGFSPNLPLGFHGRAPIIEALGRGGFDERYVNKLLYHGADVATEPKARAALHVAVGRGLPLSTIKALLAHGADVNYVPPVWNARTALQSACDHDNVSVAALLDFHGARPEPVALIAPDRSLLLLLAFGADPALFPPPILEHRDRAAAVQRVALERFRVVRLQVMRVAVGLQDLELPALVTHEICVAAFGELPMHLLWRVITAVKHFQR